MAGLMQTGSVVAGAGVPFVLRNQVDEPGSSLTRPSVLAGVGLGAAGIGASMAVSRGMLSAPVGTRQTFTQNAMLFGVTSLTVGVLSAFSPSAGGGFQAPTV